MEANPGHCAAPGYMRSQPSPWSLCSTLSPGTSVLSADLCVFHPPQDSRQHYEIEYRHRAANLEKCMSELWRMERKRDKNAREMKVHGLGRVGRSGG